jgi:hypothetical protein
MADEVNSTDPQHNHLPRNDWQILGKLQLRDNSDANGTIDHWLTSILASFSLPDDLVGRIRTSIEDAVVRILGPDPAERNFEYLEIVMLGPGGQPTKGHTWGFFRLERASTDALNENAKGHCVEYYLYLDKKTEEQN